jgi:Hydrophobic surface binding protein A
MRLSSIVQLLTLAIISNAVAVPISGDKLLERRQRSPKSGKGSSPKSSAPTSSSSSLEGSAPAGGTTANDALTQITTQLGDMNQKIQAFTGDPITAVPILDSAATVLATIKRSEEKVQGAQVLGLIETIAILIPLTSLNSAVGTVTEGLVKKKPQFDEASLTAVVSDQLELFNVEAKKLIDIVVAKLPAYLPTVIAAIFYQPILDKLGTAVTAFKPIS